jgi:hypothetical protein
MDELAKEMKRARDAQHRLEKQSPTPQFQETEGGQTIKTPEQVLTEAVTALNELAGALTLEAGANITIQTAGATIIISGPDPGASNFLGLTDTPASYVGEQGRIPAVNSLEDGLEFIDPPTGGSGAFDFGLISEATSTTQDWGSIA